MTELLIKIFIKNSNNLNDSDVRCAYGKFSGIVGIICNVILFVIKLLAGTIFNSVAITADAVNNLSDASSSVVSLLGFKMADKQADAEHPYGHARYEYLSGLLVAVMIIVIGVEILKTGISKIFNPEQIEFSPLTALVLIISILVKLWMAYFNNNLGKRIKSNTLIATAQDSRNDVISTSAVLGGLIIS